MKSAPDTETNPARHAPSVEGGCLCGSVRYALRGAPVATLHCHCADCRKASGAAFITWAVFPRDALTWTSGEPQRVEWSERTRLFCPHCGTPIGLIPPEHLGVVAITAGSLDDASLLKPACHAWTEDKMQWIHLADGLPAYDHAAFQ